MPVLAVECRGGAGAVSTKVILKINDKIKNNLFSVLYEIQYHTR